MKKTIVRDFDIAEFLDTEEAVSAYLSEVFKDGTEEEIKRALSDVARARNMTDIAKKMGVSRTSLYKSLTGTTHTEFGTIRKFLNAVGVQMTIVPSNDNKQTKTLVA